MQQIARGIFYEDTHLGVTLGALVYPLGTILIDAPLRPDDARSWRSAVLNQRGSSNRLLVNMDAHPDRTLGARAIECTIVAHQKTAQVFRNRPTIFKGQNTETGSAWEAYNDAIGMRWSLPDVTFTSRMSFFWGGPEVILEHHPGPAPGAIWVIIPAEKVIFVGDTVVINQPPFLTNADLPAWIEELNLLLTEYRGYQIVSGRGGLASIDAVRAQQKFLKDILKGLDRLTKRNSPSDAVESLIPALLSNFIIPDEYREKYHQRLRYGLTHYYARYNRSAGSSDLQHLEDNEQS